MKRSRFSEEQIIGILREVQGGGNTRAVCATHNISEGTYYAWKRKYGGMDVSEARRLRALEDENARLKRIIAAIAARNSGSQPGAPWVSLPRRCLLPLERIPTSSAAENSRKNSCQELPRFCAKIPLFRQTNPQSFQRKIRGWFTSSISCRFLVAICRVTLANCKPGNTRFLARKAQQANHCGGRSHDRGETRVAPSPLACAFDQEGSDAEQVTTSLLKPICRV
jgi:putative transposase